MIDENTPLAEHQSLVKYSATAKQDAAEGEEPPPIDRVFISIALLGTPVQSSLDGLSIVLPLTRNYR
jgi:hypothetical protein